MAFNNEGDFIVLQVNSNDYKREYLFDPMNMTQYLGNNLYSAISLLDDECDDLVHYDELKDQVTLSTYGQDDDDDGGEYSSVEKLEKELDKLIDNYFDKIKSYYEQKLLCLNNNNNNKKPRDSSVRSKKQGMQVDKYERFDVDGEDFWYGCMAYKFNRGIRRAKSMSSRTRKN